MRHRVTLTTSETFFNCQEKFDKIEFDMENRKEIIPIPHKGILGLVPLIATQTPPTDRLDW